MITKIIELSDQVSIYEVVSNSNYFKLMIYIVYDFPFTCRVSGLYPNDFMFVFWYNCNSWFFDKAFSM